MKKTLFLSAILGAALCGSAFGAEYTVGGTTWTNIPSNYTAEDIIKHTGPSDLKFSIGSDVVLESQLKLVNQNSNIKLQNSNAVTLNQVDVVSNVSVVVGFNAATALNIGSLSGGSGSVMEIRRSLSNTDLSYTNLTGDNSYAGTLNLTLENSNHYGVNHLVLSHENAAKYAEIKFTAPQNANGANELNLSTATAYVRALSGTAGSISLCSITGLTNPAAATLNVTGTNGSGAFSGNIGSGVTVDINGGAIQRLGDVTILGTLVNNGTAKLEGVITNEGTLTFKGTVEVSLDGATATDYKAVTEGNGFGTGTYSKQIVRGNGSVTDQATWSMNGQSAVYSGGVVTTREAIQSSIYYINAAGYDYTGATELVTGMDVALGSSTDGLTGIKKLTAAKGTLTLNTPDSTGKRFGGDILVQQGATMVAGVTDGMDYNATNTIFVEKGGTLSFGSKRWTMSASNKLTVAGTISGAGQSKNGALDFQHNSTVDVEGDAALISAAIRARNVTVTFKTDQDEALSITGNIYNNGDKSHIKKTGVGTLTLSGANEHTDTIVSEGKLIVAGDSALGTHNVSIANGATLEIAQGITATGFSSMSFETRANAVINGNLTLDNNAVTLHSLTMGASGLLELNSHNGTLTTSTLTVSGNSTLNANLVVNDNGTMDFSNHTELTMGCTVTIGDDVTIMVDDSELASITSGNSVMTIIKDVEGVDMDNLALTLGSGWKFVDAQGNSLDAYNLRLDVVDADNGKVNIVVAPEPATATLSLLALAGLCARRRRH